MKNLRSILKEAAESLLPQGATSKAFKATGLRIVTMTHHGIPEPVERLVQLLKEAFTSYGSIDETADTLPARRRQQIFGHILAFWSWVEGLSLLEVTAEDYAVPEDLADFHPLIWPDFFDLRNQGFACKQYVDFLIRQLPNFPKAAIAHWAARHPRDVFFQPKFREWHFAEISLADTELSDVIVPEGADYSDNLQTAPDEWLVRSIRRTRTWPFPIIVEHSEQPECLKIVEGHRRLTITRALPNPLSQHSALLLNRSEAQR